jgi:ribose-phosphate pyrophosphokinase
VKPAILSGSANPALAEAIAGKLGLRLAQRTLGRFPDGELHVELEESVRGHDVYLVQPTGPPADENLLELLLVADACRRAGSARTTAVVPYLGYARQDRRARGREPIAARLVADLIQTAGLERVVAVDLHTTAIEGLFRMPIEHLSAMPLLAEAAHPWIARAEAPGVVVAPDLGAMRLAERYARALKLPLAVVHKSRLTGDAVRIGGVTGEVRGRAPVIVDDMVSTGGTIAAAVEALLERGALADVTVVASHALLVGTAIERLQNLALRRLIVTDSVPVAADCPLPVAVVSLAPLLADVIDRLHRGRSLDDLVAHA